MLGFRCASLSLWCSPVPMRLPPRCAPTATSPLKPPLGLCHPLWVPLGKSRGAGTGACCQIMLVEALQRCSKPRGMDASAFLQCCAAERGWGSSKSRFLARGGTRCPDTSPVQPLSLQHLIEERCNYCKGKSVPALPAWSRSKEGSISLQSMGP